MNRFLQELQSPYFLLSTVVLALFVNLFSSYLKELADKVFGHISGSYKARLKRKEAERNAEADLLVARLEKNPKYIYYLMNDAISCRTGADVWDALRQIIVLLFVIYTSTGGTTVYSVKSILGISFPVATTLLFIMTFFMSSLMLREYKIRGFIKTKAIEKYAENDISESTRKHGQFITRLSRKEKYAENDISESTLAPPEKTAKP